MIECFKLIRVHQWVKNGFVLVPAFFARALFEGPVVGRVLLGALLFSLAASTIYILNDYLDREQDRRHPTKRFRPLVAGTIAPRTALLVASGLLLGWLVGSWWMGARFFGLCLGYFCLNLAYSFRLKHIALVDIAIISAGFLLRIFAGGELAGVVISKWLVIMVFLLAMMLALAKRRDEYLVFQRGQRTRQAIEGYNLPFIDAAMVLMAGVTIVAYLMYSVSEEVVNRLGNENLYLTTLLVVMGILRYLQLTLVKEESGSPTQLLLKDGFLQIVLLLWAGCFGLILYWPF